MCMPTGTYLGNEDEDTDEQVASAVIKTVAHGCNVIDTARNYRQARPPAPMCSSFSGAGPFPHMQILA